MKFETKTLAEASANEVRDYATSFLGIPSEGLSDGEVLAKVRAANDGETIYVRVDEGGVPDQAGSAPPLVSDVGSTGGLKGGLGRGDPKVQLTLHAEERDGVVSTAHKSVGVNGVVWLIKRGVSVSVPLRVFYALDVAVRENISHDQSPDNEGVPIIQKVHSTPFNIERMPPQDEIDAWQARTGDLELPA
jgi:hypothetical protein